MQDIWRYCFKPQEKHVTFNISNYHFSNYEMYIHRWSVFKIQSHFLYLRISAGKCLVRCAFCLTEMSRLVEVTHLVESGNTMHFSWKCHPWNKVFPRRNSASYT